MTEQQEVNRGNLAKQLQDNPLLQEALEAWEQEIISQFKTSPLRDVDGRERLRLMLEASKQLKAFLSLTVDRGTVAMASIRQKNPALKAVEKVRAWAR